MMFALIKSSKSVAGIVFTVCVCVSHHDLMQTREIYCNRNYQIGVLLGVLW